MQLPRFLYGLWTERDITRNLVVSAILLVFVIAARSLTMRSLSRFKKRPLADPLRLRAGTRWAALAVALLGLTIIWADELRTLALSMVAIAAALVLATKELIMCMSGALVRASGGIFEIGDRIEIDGVRGDVIDHHLLTTTVLEIGPGHQPTGRTVILPNSIFLTAKVFNETLTDNFVLHVITIPVAADADLPAQSERLLAIANEVCGVHTADAAHSLDATAAMHGLAFTSTQPRVLIQIPGPDRVHLLLAVPIPARLRGEIEQEILRRVLGHAS